MILTEHFDTYKNREIKLFILRNDYLEVGICQFGGILQRLIVNSKSGKKDIVCSTNTCQDYINSDAHIGGLIGRVANRVANAKFELNGKTYKLDENVKNATLHGGFKPYDYRVFEPTIIDDNTLKLELFSPDLDQGFPGNLTFSAIFQLADNRLKITLEGVCDQDTVFNPTIHTYFNLNGEGSGKIYDTTVQIFGDKITVSDENLVVDGTIMDVKNTPFDFLQPKTIAPDIFFEEINVKLAGGFDHNYILNGNHAATCVGDKSSIRLNLFTDFPGVQFYTGNMMKNINGKTHYEKHDAFCLEPQYFPNSVNVPSFEKPILKANSAKTHYIEYVIDEI